MLFRKYKKRNLLLYIAVGVLIIFSNQLLFYHVAKAWEGPLKNPETVEHYNGIILLGGFSSFQSESNRIRFYESADRMLQAVQLFKMNKADYLIFTGGSARLIVKEKKEGEFIKDYLGLIGIDTLKTLVEWNSRNTYENAIETKRMLKEKDLLQGRFLLVTSGSHMKRAMACFKKQRIKVTPYVTDPLQSTIAPGFGDALMPSASTLAAWERLFKEWIGLLAYKIMGYI